MSDALSEGPVIDNQCNPVGNGVPFEFLKQEIVDVATSENGRRHVWLWPTKRPKRMVAFSKWLKSEHGVPWPANLWPGASVTAKANLGRLDDLLKVGDQDTTRFASVEPQLEDVSILKWLQSGLLHWVIAGGESSQGAPAQEFKLEWARNLRDECFQASVAFFLKQLGSNPTEAGKRYRITTKHGDLWQNWPVDLRLRQMPILPAIQHIMGIHGKAEPIGPMSVRPARTPVHADAIKQAWIPERCATWAKGAKPHVIVAISSLARDKTLKTTQELNEASGCNSGGAIVGGINAWATRNGLPGPLAKRRIDERSGYTFVSEELRVMFEEVLRG